MPEDTLRKSSRRRSTTEKSFQAQAQSRSRNPKRLRQNELQPAILRSALPVELPQQVVSSASCDRPAHSDQAAVPVESRGSIASLVGAVVKIPATQTAFSPLSAVQSGDEGVAATAVDSSLDAKQDQVLSIVRVGDEIGYGMRSA